MAARLSRAIATLASLALPVVLIVGCRPPEKPSEQAETVLQQNQEAMLALKSLRVDCESKTFVDVPGGRTTRFAFGRLTAEKPSLMRYDSWTGTRPIEQKPATPPEYTFTCNGKDYVTQFGKHYSSQPKSGLRPEEPRTLSEPWNGFYSRQTSILGELKDGTIKSYELSGVGSGYVGGVPCNVIRAHYVIQYGPSHLEYNDVYYFGKHDHLLRRRRQHVGPDGQGFTRDDYLENFDLHPSIDSKIFQYAPPPGVSPR